MAKSTGAVKQAEATGADHVGRTEKQIKAMALERCVHYRERIDAREDLPPGLRAEVDLSVRIRGVATKDQDTKVMPHSTIMCRHLVAELAKELKVVPIGSRWRCAR